MTAWSPDGCFLASGCKLGTILVWNPVTGYQVGSYQLLDCPSFKLRESYGTVLLVNRRKLFLPVSHIMDFILFLSLKYCVNSYSKCYIIQSGLTKDLVRVRLDEGSQLTANG